VIDSSTEPPRRRPRRPASLRFERVKFSYPDASHKAVDGLDLDIPAGGVTALVGPSGAGKSTVFALLERFYEQDTGRILLDGRDLRDWPLGELRSLIAYVEQNAPVMAGTLRENLTYAAPSVTCAELRNVLDVCRLEGLLDRLGGSLDAHVSGSSLSGGERQRVAIARALLRQPRLLLLDEITSQLDSENEAALRDVVHEIAQHTTVIVAAHRLTTIRDADRIVVVEDGRIRTIGQHEDLLVSDELYASFAGGTPRSMALQTSERG
jgi:ABC-type multidrug transport system fused ATPase/permease subunit